MELSSIIKELKGERKISANELRRIDRALAAIGPLVSKPSAPKADSKVVPIDQPSRKISAAGRRRISIAQRARWAKVRRKKVA